MKIAVTGGSGMVGRNLQDVVQEHQGEHEYIFLTRKDFDCEERDAVMTHFEKNEYDAVLHLAADVGGLYKNINDNDQIYMKNKAINDNIIDACVKFGIKKGIFCSSSCVFPENPSKFPMNEDMMCESEPHPSNRGYAMAKRKMAIRCKELNKKGFQYLSLIPVNMYGKYDNFNIGTGHFVPALMHRFEICKNATRNSASFYEPNSDVEKYIAYGDGKPLRQLIYAKDFAEIIYTFFLQKDNWIFDSVIVCNDEEHTIKEVVEELARVMDLDKKNLVWDTSKANGCMRKTVSNIRLTNMNIFKNFKTLEYGLQETYTWFKNNNYEYARDNNQFIEEMFAG